MCWRRGLATAEALDAIKRSRGIAPGFARTQHLSGEDVLDTTAQSTDNLTLVVPHSSAITFGRAKKLPVPVIGAWSLATNSGPEGFTHAIGLHG